MPFDSVFQFGITNHVSQSKEVKPHNPSRLTTAISDVEIEAGWKAGYRKGLLLNGAQLKAC
jgi:hypothetical protein